MPADDAQSDGEPEPSDDEVVEAAADAARGLVLSRVSNSAVTDLDVTVTFEDGVLDVDVFLDVADDSVDVDRVADDAALAARAAVDDLLT